MPTWRFSNRTSGLLDLQVEPWGAVEVIAGGSTFAITYPSPDDSEGTSSIEVHDDLIRFWCAGADYQLEIDGMAIAT
jgi:hypothetical protein